MTDFVRSTPLAVSTDPLATRTLRRQPLSRRASLAAAALSLSLLALGGCAVQRGQETMGAYVDDAAITTALKGRYVEAKDVDASAISVETLNGTVMLSGFAKSGNERSAAENLAWKVKGVKAVRNEISVRP